MTPCTCRPLLAGLPCRLTRPVGSGHQSQPAGPYSFPTVASGRPLRARSTIRSAAVTSSGLSTQAGPSPPSACCQSTPVSPHSPALVAAVVPFPGAVQWRYRFSWLLWQRHVDIKLEGWRLFLASFFCLQHGQVLDQTEIEPQISGVFIASQGSTSRISLFGTVPSHAGLAWPETQPDYKGHS